MSESLSKWNSPLPRLRKYPGRDGDKNERARAMW